MSHTARLLLSGVAAAAAVAAMAPAASAATVAAPNVCYSMDGSAPQYGTLPLKLTPASVLQNGRQLDVGAVTPSVEIPSWLPDKMNSLGAGLLLGGSKNVPVTAWMAVTPSGSKDGPRVITTTGTVSIAVQSLSVRSVALTLQPSIATSWAASDAGGALTVSQGGPGSLAGVSELGGKPQGSLFIRGTVNLGLAGNLTLQIDCQPGTNATPEDPASLTPTMLPGTPAVIASATFAAQAGGSPAPAPAPAPTPDPLPAPAPTPTPAPAPTPKPSETTKPGTPLAGGTLAITSPTLKFGKAAVLVNVSCPAGGADCAGAAIITSAKKLKVGKGAAKVRRLAVGRYSVPAGATAPVKLRLSADGKRLRTKRLVATVTLRPTSGALVVKRLRANG